MRIGLHLTDRCQLDCDHCLRDPGKEPVDLAWDVIERVLDDAQTRGIERVSLTGGEPTLHPRFPELLDAVVAHGMRWDMVTNGRRFDRVAAWLEAVPARRVACASVVFSLDGASAETHDALRGAGQHREVLAAMAIAVAMEIPFATTTTVHARNAGEIEAIAREHAALGARSVRFAMMQPTGTPLDAELRLDAEGWRRAYDRIASAARSVSVPVIAAEGWPRATRTTCGPMRGETLHVDLAGQLTLCCMHAGVPSSAGGADETVIGPVHEGLDALWPGVMAHGRREMPRGVGAWADFGCNACLAKFGRPHWNDEGVGGPAATRERWRGSEDRVSPGKRTLQLAR